MLNSSVPWLTPRLREIVDQSDTLILEMAPDQQAPVVMQKLVMQHGMAPAGKTLADQVPEDTYKKLQDLLKSKGAQPHSLDNLRPWLISTMLVVQIAASEGFLPQYGVDQVLATQAMATGRRIQGLETAEEQIGLLASLTEEQQALFLGYTLDKSADILPFFEKMRDAWLSGDVETLGRLMQEGFQLTPELAVSFLYARNDKWMTKIEGLLNAPGKHFLAVGAGHLVGDKSVIDLLRRRGYTVEPVEI